MANQITCPKCNRTLRTNAPIPAGKQVKCPACQQLFVTGDPDAAAIKAKAPAPVVAKPSPPAAVRKPLAAKPQAKKTTPVVDVVEEVIEDAEPVRTARARRRHDDDDDDDRPRRRRRDEDDVDDDDRPRRRRDDDDDDDRPTRRRRDDDDDDDHPRRRRPHKSGRNLVLPLSLGGAGLLILIVMLTGFVWPGFFLSGGGAGGAGAAGAPGAAAAAAPGGVRAAQEPNPLAFVPAEANLVAGMSLAKFRAMPQFNQGFNVALQNNPQLAGVPPEIRDLLNSAETVIVAAALDRSELQALVVVTDKPYDAEKFKASLGQPTNVQGQMIYSFRPPNAPFANPQFGNPQFANPQFGNPQPGNVQSFQIAMPSPRTLVVSQLPADRFAPILVAATAVHMNQELLGQVTAVKDSMYWGVLHLDAGLKQKMQPALQSLPADAPAEVRNLVAVMQRGKALTASINLTEQTMKLHVAMACNDANDAKEANAALQSLWNTHGKQLINVAGAFGGQQLGKLLGDIGQTVAFEQREAVASASLQVNLAAIQEFVNAQQQNPGFMPFNPGFNPPGGLPKQKGPPIMPKKKFG